ncbi:MAG: 3-dehydroquinate synthase, partial [Betaproteobacteria bacterium]
CAELHLAQITQAGDPFESSSTRPLDYGHWSAHKLEALDKYKIRHGEAVAIGMALDAKYAVEVGLLAEGEAYRLINLLKNLGFVLWHPVLEQLDEQGQPLVLSGLEEFRQHLGGELRITLMTQIGTAKNVNYMELQALSGALKWLKKTVNTAGL